MNTCSINQKMIDDKDKKILGILKGHADYTTRQIAKKTLLPITTVHHRIKKLKKNGVIKKFTVDLDHQKVDRGLLIYLLISVDLKTLKEKRMTQYDVLKKFKEIDYVTRVDIVAGGSDLIAMIRVKDMEEYDKVLLQKIQKIETVSSTRSLIVIHSS